MQYSFSSIFLMETIVSNIEASLNEQLKSLADQIKLAEENLIHTKEGYLKVKGALEIIEIIKKQVQEKEAEALATGEI